MQHFACLNNKLWLPHKRNSHKQAHTHTHTLTATLFAIQIMDLCSSVAQILKYANPNPPILAVCRLAFVSGCLPLCYLTVSSSQLCPVSHTHTRTHAHTCVVKDLRLHNRVPLETRDPPPSGTILIPLVIPAVNYIWLAEISASLVSLQVGILILGRMVLIFQVCVCASTGEKYETSETCLYSVFN